MPLKRKFLVLFLILVVSWVFLGLFLSLVITTGMSALLITVPMVLNERRNCIKDGEYFLYDKFIITVEVIAITSVVVCSILVVITSLII